MYGPDTYEFTAYTTIAFIRYLVLSIHCFECFSLFTALVKFTRRKKKHLTFSLFCFSKIVGLPSLHFRMDAQHWRLGKLVQVSVVKATLCHFINAIKRLVYWLPHVTGSWVLEPGESVCGYEQALNDRIVWIEDAGRFHLRRFWKMFAKINH